MVNNSIIKKIDSIIKDYHKSSNLIKNDIIKYIKYEKIDKNKKYFFGITVHLYDNIELTKIFLKILNEKINFKDIIFCFIDDGMNISSLKLFESIKLDFDYILIKCFKDKNIFNVENNYEVGSFYPLTLYIGNQILKNNCEYLGILHSCTFISKNYFEVAKSIISNISDNSILSLFVDSKYKKFSNKVINNIKTFHSEKINKISLFYNKKFYEKIKIFFTGFDNLNKKNIELYKSLKWNNHISNYIKNNNGNIITTHESFIQHLDLYNKDYNNINYKVFDLLIKPNKYKHLQINHDFKVNNLEILTNILGLKNINSNKVDKKKINFNLNFKNKIIKLKLNINNKLQDIDIKNKNYLYQKIEGGFGNQLFMLFNLIALSTKYNLKIIPYWDKDYIKHYKNGNNVTRKSSLDYEILKNINFYNEMNNNNCDTYKEKNYFHENIKLKKKKTYIIQGYFQSYKYFWRYKNNIKKYLNINYKLIKKIKDFYKMLDKKIIGIHVRQGDYIKKSEYHNLLTIDYYRKALSYYDLNKYQIILFSDDYKNCIELLKPLNLKYIDARIYSDNDEIQFYLLMLCNIKICANSSFSLMSCYINEMYGFVEEPEYIFPEKWFGPEGPEYDINDLIPIENENFKIIKENEYKIGIFLIGTGKYKSYFDNLIPNIKKNFLPKNDKILMITTDNEKYLDKFKYLCNNKFHIITNYTLNRGFPADTMYRFEYFLNFVEKNFNFGDIKSIYNLDYLLFMNINLSIRYKINIFPFNDKNLFFTKHPGNIFNSMFEESTEQRNNVSCYLNIKNIKNEDKIYVFGALNGGKTKSYLKMCDKLKNNTIIDDLNNVIPKWHDESQLNWYRLTLDKKMYVIIGSIYCSPIKYYNKSYIDVITKNFSVTRNNDGIYIPFTNNFNNDLLNILYNINNKIKIKSLNNISNISSRQSLLKYFFRFECNKENLDNNKNDLIDINLILNENIILKFINSLNFNFVIKEKDLFLKNYSNHIIVHISDNFEEYRKDIYKFINNNNNKFLIIFHNSKYINDEIWNNLNNITKYKFNNDEEKIILSSLINNHLFYNLKDIFIIIHISKIQYNKKNKLYWIYNFDKYNVEYYNYISNNFNLNSINSKTKPGFSFIIRAKNETFNVDYCLTTLIPILKLYSSSEIIFVDNNSEDDTFQKAYNMLYEYDNTYILKYNVNVPKCGIEHQNITKKNPELSLGNFYNWCYSFSNRYNVIKWDCDFYCNLQNLCELINEYRLYENNNDLSIWFSGKQVFLKDNKFNVDDESYYLYNEPRIHSKLNGFIYEDSHDNLWETPYTKYFIKNEKKNKSYHFGFPTNYFIIRYLETNHKDYNNKDFNNKSVWEYIQNIYSTNNYNDISGKLKKNNKIYKNIKKFLKYDEKPIFYELKNINILYEKVNKLKNVDDRDKIIINKIKYYKNNDFENKKKIDLYLENKIFFKKTKFCFLILICDKYQDRQKNIIEYMKKNVNYDVFFIKANSNLNETTLDNNILTVNCSECYENLPKKMILALKYLYNNFNYDYFLKIDDDTKLNLEILNKFINNNFYNLDYLGYKAGGHVDKDWHFGKCQNEELNSKLYWNGYHGFWCGGGYGYILSRSSVSILMCKKNFEYIYNEIYEDKAIGDILRKEVIKPCFEFLPDLKISKKIDMIGDDYIFISNH